MDDFSWFAKAVGIALGICVWAMFIIAIGAMARITVSLFCLGYGC